MGKERPTRRLLIRIGSSAAVTQRGASLLEVLIAVLVLAVGVLGAVSLQVNALRYNASAAYNTQASFLAYDILDRMRANADNLASYAINVNSTCAAGNSGSSILAVDRQDFAHAVSCLLPGGYGSVVINGNHATVTVGWSEERIVAAGGNTQFIVSSMIRGDL
ncbi:type IV pilus modification protein PilV [Pseudomonas sp. FME51]|uniref:type IV pilus modification protein PilV n=1 Tax=Pseudomonas sp. FME51 TaxID=2742609 RepID=UPI001866CA11|nr:type IV pilus modification protein PilV [Pseudomonas sp. FME51]